MTVEASSLEVTLINGPPNVKSQYSFDNTDENRIIFGRADDCDIVYSNVSAISRYHCFVWFDKNNGWMIMDGDGTDSVSTNGTWSFVEQPILIRDNLTFKSAKSVFKARFAI